MLSASKNLRYYYWYFIEFFKKQFIFIALCTLVTSIIIFSLISLSPYVIGALLPQKEVIGRIGSFSYTSIPDDILNQISNGLLIINEKGEYVPALASSWEILDNGRKYRINLRKDLLWNDNRLFDTKDINYKFKDVSVKVINNYSFEFNLQRRLPIFLSYLTRPIIRYPLIGVAGLFRVEKIRSQSDVISEIYLTPNKSGFKPIIYKFYDNESQMINAYKLGEINQMIVQRKNTADTFKDWTNTLVSKSVDYSRLFTLFFNLKNPIFKEKDIRQAVSEAIDRASLSALGVVADSPIPPVSWAYNKNLKKKSYDPDATKAILKKYITASDSAKIQISTYYDYLDSADQINKFLTDVGLKSTLSIISSGDLSDFDVLITYWKVPVDPDQYFFWHSTQAQGNITSYKNVKIDKLLEDGRDTVSIEDRKQIYSDFQKIIVDDDPALFLYYPYIYTIKRK